VSPVRDQRCQFPTSRCEVDRCVGEPDDQILDAVSQQPLVTGGIDGDVGDRAAVVMSEQRVRQNLLNEFVEVTALIESAALDLQQCGAEEVKSRLAAVSIMTDSLATLVFDGRPELVAAAGQPVRRVLLVTSRVQVVASHV
jgi:hypothetical protein